MNNENNDKGLNPDYVSNNVNDGVNDKNKNNIEKKENKSELQNNNYGLSSIDNLLETNISDWDYTSAKNYVVEFIATAKSYKDDYLEKIDEIKKWAKRIELARENNRKDLLEIAENNFYKLSREAERLKNEYKKMKMHADVLKSQLAEKTKFVPENDPSILLNKLETLLNKNSEEIEFEEQMNKTSMEEKLEKLKKKIKEEENNNNK